MTSIAQRLHEALAELTDKPAIAAVARQAQIKPVTARTYFKDERNPPLDVCIKLGRVLGVRGEWIFDGKGPKRNQPAESEVKGAPRFSHVPLIDEVAAGKLTAPGSQIPFEDVPVLLFADLEPGEFFATRVTGTSMDRVSPTGSIILVNRRDITLVTGRFYIFSLRGETTYKRWQGGDPAYLEPFSTDSAHRPQFIRRMRDLVVIGRVRRTIFDL